MDPLFVWNSIDHLLAIPGNNNLINLIVSIQLRLIIRSFFFQLINGCLNYFLRALPYLANQP